MDDVARYNIERWQALADADALFTRPSLSLDAESAQADVDPEGLLGSLEGRNVLCLAGGGGQQSAAFGVLGAHVTVLDLSEAQLERDRRAAAHYGHNVKTIQGDMRDLSALAVNTFDVVFQPHSLGFVPDSRVVFAEVSRVIRRGGVYFFAIANPFYVGMNDNDWNGEGYVLRLPYVDGGEVTTPDPDWVYRAGAGPVPVCREYRQSLSRLINGLVGVGFEVIHLSDTKHLNPDPMAEGGTWAHRNAIAPAWIAIWSRYSPAV